MNLKAVLFDLYGTLAYVKDPISSEEISEFLLEHDYGVYPQSLDAASHYVGMIDYPKHGYNSWKAYLKQVLYRLDIKVDAQTLGKLVDIYEKHRTLTLFPDVSVSVRRAKTLDLKTAIVTTIANFCFDHAVEPIRESFDVVMTGYEAGCEKSNPAMHEQVLEKLNVQSNNTVMIGDDLLVDIKIPKNMGIYTIFLDREANTRKPKEADAKATTLLEAMDIIESWLKGISPTKQ